jgi:peptidyl-dipeptidase A
MAKTVDDTAPLYRRLHQYARRELAARYGQPAPDQIPAHWLPNRWGQDWPGLAESVNLDARFRSRSPEWIVQQAERFYTSLGWPSLPKSFWEKSDLYQLPAGSPRKKNTHAWAYHIDLNQDVRSLMSIVPNWRWFETAHHELGHVYYYLAFSNPDVPMVLRGGANRAFDEAVGYLISLASRQEPYLRQAGVIPPEMKIDRDEWLLNEALSDAVVFLPWSAGTMAHFEYDLYEKKLPADAFNRDWWSLAARYQGVRAPAPRGEQYCDGCTKTHIIDDPAQYYDYALAYLIRYQLHDYIARNILHQDPHSCNYYGNKQVGKWLWEILSLGATRDWRQVLREKTGEEISTRAMLEYFRPLDAYLSRLEAEAGGARK